jgi:hypothetical protein
MGTGIPNNGELHHNRMIIHPPGLDSGSFWMGVLHRGSNLVHFDQNHQATTPSVVPTEVD